MDVVRQALPMVLSLLKMALVICIPLVLLIGTYELKTVVAVSCVEFALFFVDFWFQLARWLDSTILDAALRLGFRRESAAHQLRSVDRPEQRLRGHVVEFRDGHDVQCAAAFGLLQFGWVGIRVGAPFSERNQWMQARLAGKDQTC